MAFVVIILVDPAPVALAAFVVALTVVAIMFLTVDASLM
jgi:hypothetical protein